MLHERVPQVVKDRLKSWLGPEWTVVVRCLVRGLPLPHWGNLRRTQPFSRDWGFDRGTPVDRYYLHAFLDKHRQYIRGDVLEIQAPIYTREYGHDLKRCDSV